jgi:hypothetical protein
MITSARLLANIAHIRASVEVFLLDVCTIKHHVGYVVERGQSNPAYTIEDNVPCRVINKSGADNVQVASQYRSVQQATNVSLIRIQLPFDQEINLNDKVIIDDIEHSVAFPPIKHKLMGAFVVWLKRET